MALAERMLAARFGKSLVDHRTWALCSDGDLMEGISHEAIGLAGHLRLEKLTFLYDDNNISIDGDTSLARSEDTLKRFAAEGWATKAVDGHDPAQVAAALSFAMRSKKPTLIACRTIIGLGAPTKAGTAAVHGSALGAKEAAEAKQALGWHEPPFTVPDELMERWRSEGTRGAAARRAWLKRLARHAMRSDFERSMAGKLPEGWHETLAALKQEIAEQKPKLATRAASQKVLEALIPATPELVGGAADLTPSTLTFVKSMGAVNARQLCRPLHPLRHPRARHGRRGQRHGRAWRADPLHRHVLRLHRLHAAGDSHRRHHAPRVIHVLTHDSIGLGEDGPTHQPVEHLASLRAMPNLHVLRPADTMETAECWELAIRRTEGPSLLVLSRQAVPAMRTDTTDNRCARGGYVIAEAEGARQATVIGTGTEVAIAMDAREALGKEGIPVAVVSLPCWELFAQQDEAYRAEVLGGAPRIGIEAASPFGWERWLGPDGCFIGMTTFGASGPWQDVYKEFGITADAVVAAVKKRVG